MPIYVPRFVVASTESRCLKYKCDVSGLYIENRDTKAEEEGCGAAMLRLLPYLKLDSIFQCVRLYIEEIILRFVQKKRLDIGLVHGISCQRRVVFLLCILIMEHPSAYAPSG